MAPAHSTGYLGNHRRRPDFFLKCNFIPYYIPMMCEGDVDGNVCYTFVSEISIFTWLLLPWKLFGPLKGLIIDVTVGKKKCGQRNRLQALVEYSI